MEPAICFKHLISHSLGFVIPREICRAPNQHLALWLNSTCGVVIHVGHTFQPEFCAGCGWPHCGLMLVVRGRRDEGCRRSLSQSITLYHRCAHCYTQEFFDVWRQRGAPAYNDLHIASQPLRQQLAEHNLVKEGGSLVVCDALAHEVQLALETPVEHRAFNESRLLDLLRHAGVDTVQHAWHGNKEGRLKLAKVSYQLRNITLPVANGTAKVQERLLVHTIEDVRQRQVRQH
mmetsp:Transcript_9256/g.16317  ORF Transcript_9256/g.16317 Transcript_9256/m.16317 type:complete len:232 (+) Transcript_9256:1242-1937(+)